MSTGDRCFWLVHVCLTCRIAYSAYRVELGTGTGGVLGFEPDKHTHICTHHTQHTHNTHVHMHTHTLNMHTVRITTHVYQPHTTQLEDSHQPGTLSMFFIVCSALSGVLDGMSDERDRFRRDPRAQDEDEELWFEDEPELEQETTTQSAAQPRTPTPSLPLTPFTGTPQTPPINISEARTPVEVSTEETTPTYVGTPRPHPPPRPLPPLVDNLQQKPVGRCVWLCTIDCLCICVFTPPCCC